MLSRRAGRFGPIVLALFGAQAFAADCKVAKLADFPITMTGMQPVATAKINGSDVSLVVDSGAFYSMISPASAAELNLSLKPAPWGLTVRGVNGDTSVSVATTKVFTIAGADIPKVEFLVGGSHVSNRSVGVLGQNFLQRADVEYDLATGVIRLLVVKGCRKANLAYWIKPEQTYSELTIGTTSAFAPHAIGSAYVNGKKIRVLFDTGASTSILSLRAAEDAGVTPTTPGAIDAGTSYGFGGNMLRNFIAPFASFKIGDEEIRNTRLRIGPIDSSMADMLLGADFFLSHHILISNSQSKVYFTYNGGAVFNLAAGKATPRDSGTATQEVGDPAELSRRGAASVARRDYAAALVDLTRAIELAPNTPDYVYERAVAYAQNQQFDLALQDLNRVVELQPDHVPGLLARAELEASRNDTAAASADLAAADRAASKEADARLRMAGAYEKLGDLHAAIAQLNQWIQYHDHDAREPKALAMRCWASAHSGEGVAQAAHDCDSALRTMGKSVDGSHVYNSRALIRFREGDYKKSIDDFDSSLKLTPNNAWSLYGRGIARMRSGKTGDGQADIAAATALRADVAEEFRKIDIVP